MREARARSLTKSITWRVIGTLNLIFVGYFYTGSSIFSINIGAIDLVSNTILYFIHERIWNSSDWEQFGINNLFADSRKRSIAKAMTWRLSATSYLILISFLLSGEISMSIGIALTDAAINIAEYYLHERVWDKIHWGKDEYIFIDFFKKIRDKYQS